MSISRESLASSLVGGTTSSSERPELKSKVEENVYLFNIMNIMKYIELTNINEVQTRAQADPTGISLTVRSPLLDNWIIDILI